jgi:hydrogenase maturation protein HypF
LSGLIQGQGVRPTVARLATHLALRGFVRNTSRGVQVVVAGNRENVLEFERQIRVLFDVQRDHVELNPTKGTGFSILPSEIGADVTTIVPPDKATCQACFGDLDDPNSRRYRYPFVSCADCGPRYSIVRAMPFDRDRTTMVDFPMCRDCQREYEQPNDRRFHAQTNACPVCGPSCWATDCDGKLLARDNDAVCQIVDVIRNGGIAAIKGLGGYQLLCDARQADTVRLLRDRKHRPSKPFPVMVANLSTATQHARLTSQEQTLLTSPIAPVLLVEPKGQTSICEPVRPGLNRIGILLPTTPLHRLLCLDCDFPLVVTSGNVSGSPLVCEQDRALALLANIADVFLHHNRRILRPVDDSVMQWVAGRGMTLRCARGLAPLSFARPNRPHRIATGGHQQVAVAIGGEQQYVLGPHIGDLDGEASRVRWRDQIDALQGLYKLSAEEIATDRHPEYFTNRASRSEFADCKVVEVQHHHAHVAAAILEHNLETNEPILGFAFDGTGYGDDDTVWGGELLLASRAKQERIGHLLPFRLPGGSAAIRQPWRTALAALSQIADASTFRHWHQKWTSHDDDRAFRFSMSQGPVCTSMGRLFDVVAAIVLQITEAHYEGEAAIRLEAICDRREPSAYTFAFEQRENLRLIDWRPVIRAVLNELRTLSPGNIAMKFHRAIANLILDVCRTVPERHAVVCGGVFQNRVLLELLHEAIVEDGIGLHLPGKIPVGDGGLAMGQLVVADAVAHNRGKSSTESSSCA